MPYRTLFLLLMFHIALNFNVLSQCNISVTDVQIQSPTCYGGQNGNINVSVLGQGTPLIQQLSWLTMQQVPINNGNSVTAGSGNYILQVTDSNGCVKSFQYSIPEPDSIVIFVENKVLCLGESVELIDSIKGNKGSIQITWTSTVGVSCHNCNSSVVNPLETQIYHITVTDSIGCTRSANVKIVVLDSVKTNILSMAEKCGDDGQLTVLANGGSNHFKFSINGSPFQRSNKFIGLPHGFYSVQIKDSLGCNAIDTITISSRQLQLNEQLNINNVRCPRELSGSLSIVTNPGTVSLFSIDSTNYQTNPNFANLSKGLYRLYIQDTNKCLIIKNFEITEPDSPQINLLSTDLTCFESQDGIILVNTAAGTNPVNGYAIHNPGNFQVSGIFKNLNFGPYRVFIRDSSNCIYRDSVFLSQPSEFSIDTVFINDNICFGEMNGSIEILASGRPNFIYSINGIQYQNSPKFKNLHGGLYNLYLQDSSGCEITETVEVEEPPESTISFELSHISCFSFEDGEIIVITSGGTSILRYSLNGTEYQFSNTFDSLEAGVYTIFIQDTNECTQTAVVSLFEPDELGVMIELTVQGGLGNADLTVNGGSGQYSFIWSTGDTLEDLTGLISGNYSVTVTDSMGCVYIDSFNLVTTGTGIHLPDGQIIEIFPNPTEGQLNISFDLIKSQDADFMLYDMTGKLIIIYKEIQVGSNTLAFDLSSLSSGFYIIKIGLEEQTVSRKILKD